MATKKGFTLTELLIVGLLTIIVLTSTIGVFVVAKKFYATGMANQELQRDADIVMGRIIRGLEGAGTGLRSASSFVSPVANITRIDYNSMDGRTRSFYLSAGSIIYESPTQAPAAQILYTPPANAVLTLWFWEPITQMGQLIYPDHEMITIYVGITETISGKTSSGSLTTSINIRNLPK